MSVLLSPFSLNVGSALEEQVLLVGSSFEEVSCSPARKWVWACKADRWPSASICSSYPDLVITSFPSSSSASPSASWSSSSCRGFVIIAQDNLGKLQLFCIIVTQAMQMNSSLLCLSAQFKAKRQQIMMPPLMHPNPDPDNFWWDMQTDAWRLKISRILVNNIMCLVSYGHRKRCHHQATWTCISYAW